MLTLFALPKPFQGHIEVIQRNALQSWIRLRPHCQIILFGDEKGTADIAREFGLTHVPQVNKNDFGTPLLNDLFSNAQRLTEHATMCFVNSDIILFQDFSLAVQHVRQHFAKFLAVGQCWNLDLSLAVDFERPDWDDWLRTRVKREGQARGPWAIDYFVFPRASYNDIPAFALGRAYFDNWLIWKAIAQKTQVVDFSPVATVIHQNHDYSHIAGGQHWVYRGPEAVQNVNIGGGISRRYCILDATFRLTPSGPKRNLLNKLNWTMLKIWQKRTWYFILDCTRSLRHSLGIRSDVMQRFIALLRKAKIL